MCGVVWCYTGDPAAVDELFAPIRARSDRRPRLGRADAPYPALQSAVRRALPAEVDQWYWRADFVNEIPDEAVASTSQHGAAMPTPQSTMHLYPIDGAAAGWPATPPRWLPGLQLGHGHRRRRPRPGTTTTCCGLVRATTTKRLHPYSAGGAYVNFIMDEGDGPGRGHLRRATTTGCAQIKAAYDPDNLFHVNQNIPPAPPVTAAIPDPRAATGESASTATKTR